MTRTVVELNAAALPPFRDFASVGEGCAALGAFLGLRGSASPDVFYSAVQDPTYARNLIISRCAPAFLNALLDRPPLRHVAPLRDGPGRPAIDLLATAARSIWAWSRSGLKTVSDAAYHARLAACRACPHYQDPPQRAVYGIAAKLAVDGADRRICGLCGCITGNKARMATESCPDADVSRPGFTRWGEPTT